MPTLPPPIRRSLIRALRPRAVRLDGRRRKIEIAIFKPDRLGDFILASGTIRRVREIYGPENCALIVADFAEDLARKLFGNSLIIGVPPAHNDLLRGVLPGIWKMRPLLAGYQFGKVLCLRHQRSIFQELLLGYMPNDEAFGLRNPRDCVLPSDLSAYEFSFTQALPYPATAPAQSCREIEANRLVLSMALQRPVEDDEVLPRLEFPSAPETLDDTVIVSPFGTSDIRTYPLLRLVEVLRTVQQRRKVRFLLCSPPNDAGRLAELHQLAEQAGVRDVAVRTPPSFLDFCSLVASARGVISVETSTAHLAAALDKPAAIIIGGGQYGEFGPWQRSQRQAWFTHEMPCFGCNWTCIHPEPFCITQVPPDIIAQALIERL